MQNDWHQPRRIAKITRAQHPRPSRRLRLASIVNVGSEFHAGYPPPSSIGLAMKRVEPEVLETGRLVLRPVAERDVEPLYGMRMDEEWAFFGAPGRVTKSAVTASVRQAVETGWAHGPYFVITLAGEVVGDAVLQVDPVDENANLGYAVARPYWGQGIATEAARALVTHGFESWDLPRIFARADPRNIGSIRVLEAIPMIYEGTLRSHHIRRDERVDRALYGLLQSEWQRTLP